MTTAIIGTGGIGSAIARQLAAGGEALQLSSADKESARKLAGAIGGATVVALDRPKACRRSHLEHRRPVSLPAPGPRARCPPGETRGLPGHR